MFYTFVVLLNVSTIYIIVWWTLEFVYNLTRSKVSILNAAISGLIFSAVRNRDSIKTEKT